MSVEFFSKPFFFIRMEETVELQLNEEMVNLGQKLGPPDFELKKVLGKGGYGKVFQVKYLLIVANCDP